MSKKDQIEADTNFRTLCILVFTENHERKNEKVHVPMKMTCKEERYMDWRNFGDFMSVTVAHPETKKQMEMNCGMEFLGDKMSYEVAMSGQLNGLVGYQYLFSPKVWGIPLEIKMNYSAFENKDRKLRNGKLKLES